MNNQCSIFTALGALDKLLRDAVNTYIKTEEIVMNIAVLVPYGRTKEDQKEFRNIAKKYFRKTAKYSYNDVLNMIYNDINGAVCSGKTYQQALAKIRLKYV